MKALALSVCGVLATGVLAACGGVENVSPSQPEVVGGWQVDQNTAETVTYKSTVALTSDNLVRQGGNFCSGTLISPKLVLTAAHCIVNERGARHMPESDLRVAFGFNMRSGAQKVKVAKAVHHPDYDPKATISDNPTKAPNDIGIIVLAEPIPQGYEPAKLNSRKLATGVKLLVAGFGSSFSGLFANPGRLRAAYLDFSKQNDDLMRIETSTPFRSACSGDSGGPLYLQEDDGSYTLAGVVSAGQQVFTICSGKNLFTDASRYADWIRTFH